MIRLHKRPAGVLTDGTEATVYTVDNGSMSVSFLDYGCIITSILLPDDKTYGGYVDVNLGHSTLDGWVHRNQPNFGALVGRYANRIKNGVFTLDGETYTLDKNNLGNCLHGGNSPYRGRLWRSGEYDDGEWRGVRFFGVSPDGDQGFPGNLELEVFYLLNEDNDLMLRYLAATDAPTPINLTNHAYFNLSGHKSGTIAHHTCHIHGDYKRLEVAPEDLVPTGKILDVKGTVFDFSTPASFGERFEHKDLAATNGGYDMCCVWNDDDKDCDVESGYLAGVHKRITVSEKNSGRSLSVSSNQPCCQLYTSNNLKPTIGKDGFTYDKYGAFCLETAAYTNAPNIPGFPSAILQPGDLFDAVTIYHFGF